MDPDAWDFPWFKKTNILSTWLSLSFSPDSWLLSSLIPDSRVVICLLPGPWFYTLAHPTTVECVIHLTCVWSTDLEHMCHSNSAWCKWHKQYFMLLFMCNIECITMVRAIKVSQLMRMELSIRLWQYMTLLLPPGFSLELKHSVRLFLSKINVLLMWTKRLFSKRYMLILQHKEKIRYVCVCIMKKCFFFPCSVSQKNSW